MGCKVGTVPLQTLTTPIAASSKDPTPDQALEVPFLGSDPNTRPVSTKANPPAFLFGRMMKPVAGVLLALTLGAGCAAHGQTLDQMKPPEPPVVSVSTPSVPLTTPPVTQADYNRAITKLEERRNGNKIDAMQFERARQLLNRGLADPSVSVPRDHRGRIDVDALVLNGMIDVDGRNLSRGAIVMERLGQRLEYRMRITARDMVNPDLQRLEGAPGYKVIPEGEIRDMLVDALQDIPLNELPGGERIAALVKNLPNAGGIDAGNLSFRELGSQLGDANRDWAKEHLRPLIDGHEVEVGIVALSAITGLRYASPDAAKLMDQLSLRTTIYRHTSEDGSTTARARLAYRDQHVFPDIDLDAGTRYTIGDTTLRAGLTGTLSAEADDIFSATATAGAHYQNGQIWADSSASYRTDLERWRANITVGRYDPDTTWNFSTGVTATFGDGVAIGDAPGRYRWETDLTRDIDLGGAKGDFGLFTGFGIDSDGHNDDIQAGIVFRLRW